MNEPKGTAHKSKSIEYLFSGKTGTSQVRRISLEEREDEEGDQRAEEKSYI